MRITRLILLALTLGLTAVVLIGCRTAPVYNVENAHIPTQGGAPSLEQVREAIIRAGTQLGWRMTPEAPGHIVGTLHLRTHMAKVAVNYDRDDYSITYQDSSNLDYDGEKIHQNYNGWIQNLDNGIRQELLLL